jgi:hypothetical protein
MIVFDEATHAPSPVGHRSPVIVAVAAVIRDALDADAGEVRASDESGGRV